MQQATLRTLIMAAITASMLGACGNKDDLFLVEDPNDTSATKGKRLEALAEKLENEKEKAE